MAGWTGPRERDLNNEGKLLRELRAEHWPFCWPHEHEKGCMLRMKARGTIATVGSFCDCAASAEDED